MHLPYIDFLSLCACSFVYSSLCHGGFSLAHLFLMAPSALWRPSTFTSAVPAFSTRSRFFLFVHKAMLPRTLISIDATPCTALASPDHALHPPQGPTYLPPGHTPSILVNIRSTGDTHDAWVFTPLYTLHHHIPISDLARGVSHGISLATPH